MDEVNNNEKNAEADRSDLPPALHGLLDDFNRASTVEDISKALVLHGLPTLNACVIILALLTEDGSEFYCPQIEGYSEEVANTWRRFPSDAPLPIPIAVRENRPILLETLEQRQAFYPPALQLPPPVGRALAAIPFQYEGMTGGLGFTFPNDRIFEKSDRELLTTVAGLCGAALAKVRLYGLGVEVLVVEDEPAVLRMLNFVLRYHAFTVRSASGGDEAIRIFEQHEGTIDVALMDVQMPGMDGPRTLSALQSIDPQIRCIFMSGNTGIYTCDQLLARGAIRVLSKPLSGLDQLMKELRDVARM